MPLMLQSRRCFLALWSTCLVLNNSDVFMQSNSNPSTTQIFSLGVSSFDPPKNRWDVTENSQLHPPLMTACPRRWLRLKPCRLRWLKRKCWRRRRCQSIEMEAVGRVGSWFRNAGGLGNVFLVPKKVLKWCFLFRNLFFFFFFPLEGC